MIDITTLTEFLEPLSGIEIAAPNVSHKSTRALWIVLLVIIAIFGIWGYIIYSDREKINDSNYLT